MAALRSVAAGRVYPEFTVRAKCSGFLSALSSREIAKAETLSKRLARFVYFNAHDCRYPRGS